MVDSAAAQSLKALSVNLEHRIQQLDFKEVSQFLKRKKEVETSYANVSRIIRTTNQVLSNSVEEEIKRLQG